MKPFGIIILIIGIIIGIYALSMDTSVKVNYGGNSYGMPERVNNLGLMNKKQNLLIVSGLMSLIGIIMIITANRKTETNTKETKETFKETLEKAKKAEYIEDYNSALSLYLETLYHLENDYSDKKISEEWNKSRLELIDSLKKKTENIRNRKKE